MEGDCFDQQIKIATKEKMIKPMLASEGDKEILNKKDYIYEPKLDGIRALCIKGKKLKFVSRNGIDITEKYPEFDFMKNIRAKNCILDGEIVVYNEKGNPDFKLWQKRNKSKGVIEPGLQATYVVFDILFLNSKDLMNKSLIERKKRLDKIIKNNSRIQVSFFTKKGKELWNIIKKKKLEGIIAKKADSVYETGIRSNDWLKIKIHKTIDCIILGYTKEKRAITSLALGLYYKNKLIFCGKVGTGFDEKTVEDLKNKLEKIKVSKSKVEGLPEDVFQVKALLAAEIKYQDITNDKKLRAPVFIRLRYDKALKECTLK